MTDFITDFVATYTTKATAVRGAKRKGLEMFVIVPNGAAFDLFEKLPAVVETPVVEAPVVKAKRVRKASTPRTDLIKSLPVEKSSVEKPVDVARAFILANPDMKRKDIIVALVGKGLNKNMVATRISWVRSGRDPICKN